MNWKPQLQRALLLLLVAALLLPAVTLVLAGLGGLLRAMGDLAGGAVLERLALAGGVLWVLSLLFLLLAQAVLHLLPPQDE